MSCFEIRAYSPHQELIDQINDWTYTKVNSFAHYRWGVASASAAGLVCFGLGAPWPVFLVGAGLVMGYAWFASAMEKHHAREHVHTQEQKIEELKEMMRHHDYSLDPLFHLIFERILTFKNNLSLDTDQKNAWLKHVRDTLLAHHNETLANKEHEMRRASRLEILPMEWDNVDEDWSEVTSVYCHKTNNPVRI